MSYNNRKCTIYSMFLYANDLKPCNLCNEYTYADLKVSFLI